MQEQKEKILITVKTYPNLSKKYDELVCTAGLKDDGTWIRLYPIPFRRLDYDQQYKKYQWIELDVKRRTEDFRVESYSPVDIQSMKIIGEPLDTSNNWRKRKDIVFKSKKYENLDELISKAKNKKHPISLALFKPKEILDFIIEPADKQWDESTLKEIKTERNQLKLFKDDLNDLVELAEKLPFKFSYRLKDIKGKESTMMIEDWEIGALYRNCIKQSSEKEAKEKVRDKYMELAEKDIHLFLGTTFKYHYIAPNPFVIVGVFYPPIAIEKQHGLL